MLLDYKSKEYKNWFRKPSEPVTYAELFTIKEHIRKDGANLTAILTVSKKILANLTAILTVTKKIIPKLNGNIDRNKKNHTQT